MRRGFLATGTLLSSMLVVLAAVITMVGLPACSTSPNVNEPDRGAATADAGEQGVPDHGSQPSPDAPTPTVARMGIDTVTIADGLVVSLSKPVKYQPSQYADRPTRNQRAFVTTITITNKSSAPFELSNLQLSSTVGKAGVTAEFVYDSAAKVMGTPDGVVAVGRKGSAKVAFVADTTDTTTLTVAVTTWFGDDTALFEGSL